MSGPETGCSGSSGGRAEETDNGYACAYIAAAGGATDTEIAAIRSLASRFARLIRHLIQS